MLIVEICSFLRLSSCPILFVLVDVIESERLPKQEFVSYYYNACAREGMR